MVWNKKMYTICVCFEPVKTHNIILSIDHNVTLFANMLYNKIELPRDTKAQPKGGIWEGLASHLLNKPHLIKKLIFIGGPVKTG